jgi:D-alanyl-D-alanine dipeptidase
LGKAYDCFDALSHTADPRITGVARQNRDLLVNAMNAAGSTNLAEEWWHVTLRGEPVPRQLLRLPRGPIVRVVTTVGPPPGQRSRSS